MVVGLWKNQVCLEMPVPSAVSSSNSSKGENTGLIRLCFLLIFFIC